MTDLERLRAEYADRHRRLAESDIYSHFNQANLFMVQNRQRATLSLMRKLDFSNMRSMVCSAAFILDAS